MDKKFTISYLPLFEQDLAAARDYVAHVLQNPAAALRLVEDTEKAILKRLDNPLTCSRTAPQKNGNNRITGST
jgi:plasmid stabilization system protein ParE